MITLLITYDNYAQLFDSVTGKEVESDIVDVEGGDDEMLLGYIERYTALWGAEHPIVVAAQYIYDRDFDEDDEEDA